MHEVLVNCLGGLSLPRKSVVRLTDRPDMTLDVYHGRKTTMQQQQHLYITRIMINNGTSHLRITKEPKQKSGLGTASNKITRWGASTSLWSTNLALSSALVPQTLNWKIPSS